MIGSGFGVASGVIGGAAAGRHLSEQQVNISRAPEPEKTGVPRASQLLNDAQDRLAHGLNVLADRLAVVMKPPQSTCDETQDCALPFESELAVYVYQNALRVQRQAQLVEDLLRRIEV